MSHWTLYEVCSKSFRIELATGANPGDVFGNALTVNRQQASNLGPGIADIQLSPYQPRRQDLPLVNYYHIVKVSCLFQKMLILLNFINYLPNLQRNIFRNSSSAHVLTGTFGDFSYIFF